MCRLNFVIADFFFRFLSSKRKPKGKYVYLLALCPIFLVSYASFYGMQIKDVNEAVTES